MMRAFSACDLSHADVVGQRVRCTGRAKILRRLASSTETLLLIHVIPYYSFWV